ncbi:MAG: hypothetical protein K0S60_556 [Evtepia sp.]|nr:hypothetical protein [Evtepia sp.]
MQTPARKSWHPLLAPILLIVLFAAVSFASIPLMEQQREATNQLAWMSFTRYPPIELSEKQAEIIQNSAVMTSSVAEDAGVKVTLASVCGNGYITYYKLDVELPEEIKSWSFEKFELKTNDENAQLKNKGGSLMPLDDDNPRDQHYTFLMKTEIAHSSDFEYSFRFDYSFHNGITRTLHLENIQVYSKDFKVVKTIKGQWDFGVLFRDEGKVVDLISKPVTIHGSDYWDKTYFEAKVTSVFLSEFSLYCSYELTPNTKKSTLDGMGQWIIMKDGRTVRANPSGGSNSDTNGDLCWDFDVPISLEEVAFVKLSDDVLIPIS